MTPCKLVFDDSPEFAGFAHGSTWNGWDNVAVTPEVRSEIVAYFHGLGLADTSDLEQLPTGDNGLISLGWGYTTEIVEPG